MVIKSFLKGIWHGLKWAAEDPWLFMGSAALIMAFVVLTAGAGKVGRVSRNAEPGSITSTADATSRR